MKADYAITGAWFSENKRGSEHISHVMLHPMNDTTIYQGQRTNKDAVVTLLKQGKKIITMKWSYQTATWNWGAEVTYETRNGVNYLRTKPDGDITNNLDNTIDMVIFPW